ncbi:hypothetical protein HDV05_005724 [Chytridiales sp. JEL 0842]|nr:hypothetical protein HDV05_005724 [Chytridiales sp. JEL 0842]
MFAAPLKRSQESESNMFPLFNDHHVSPLGVGDTRSPLSTSGLFGAGSSTLNLYNSILPSSESSGHINYMTQALLEWEGGRSAERIAAEQEHEHVVAHGPDQNKVNTEESQNGTAGAVTADTVSKESAGEGDRNRTWLVNAPGVSLKGPGGFFAHTSEDASAGIKTAASGSSSSSKPKQKRKASTEITENEVVITMADVLPPLNGGVAAESSVGGASQTKAKKSSKPKSEKKAKTSKKDDGSRPPVPEITMSAESNVMHDMVDDYHHRHHDHAILHGSSAIAAPADALGLSMMGHYGTYPENPAAIQFRRRSELSSMSIISDGTAVMMEDTPHNPIHASTEGGSTSAMETGSVSYSSGSLDHHTASGDVTAQCSPVLDDSQNHPQGFLTGMESTTPHAAVPSTATTTTTTTATTPPAVSEKPKGPSAAAIAAAAAAGINLTAPPPPHPTHPPVSKHKRERQRTHTPRPSNSFILYRREKHSEIMSTYQGAKALNNNVISKIVANMWKDELPEVKAKYAAKAEEEKRIHMLKYPDYKYRPRKSPQKGQQQQQQQPGKSGGSKGVVGNQGLAKNGRVGELGGNTQHGMVAGNAQMNLGGGLSNMDHAQFAQAMAARAGLQFAGAHGTHASHMMLMDNAAAAAYYGHNPQALAALAHGGAEWFDGRYQTGVSGSSGSVGGNATDGKQEKKQPNLQQQQQQSQQQRGLDHLSGAPLLYHTSYENLSPDEIVMAFQQQHYGGQQAVAAEGASGAASSGNLSASHLYYPYQASYPYMAAMHAAAAAAAAAAQQQHLQSQHQDTSSKPHPSDDSTSSQPTTTSSTSLTPALKSTASTPLPDKSVHYYTPSHHHHHAHAHGQVTYAPGSQLSFHKPPSQNGSLMVEKAQYGKKAPKHDHEEIESNEGTVAVPTPASGSTDFAGYEDGTGRWVGEDMMVGM